MDLLAGPKLHRRERGQRCAVAAVLPGALIKKKKRKNKEEKLKSRNLSVPVGCGPGDAQETCHKFLVRVFFLESGKSHIMSKGVHFFTSFSGHWGCLFGLSADPSRPSACHSPDFLDFVLVKTCLVARCCVANQSGEQACLDAVYVTMQGTP